MRSRLVREGSVGLLILLGLGAFGLIFLWLNRITAAGRTYSAIIEFKDAAGMQKGAVVRYRGVKVGNIAAIRPGANTVKVEVNINKPDLIIPRDVKVEANQSGLISESIIDITPIRNISRADVNAGPLDANCDPTLIVCNGSSLKGEIGISVDQLIRYSSRLSEAYSRPDIYENVNQALKSTSLAASQVAQLTRDVSSLTKTTQQELKTFASAARQVATATNQVSVSTGQTINQFGDTANQLNATAKEFSGSAKEISAAANEASRLLRNVDSLVTSNRSSLVTALNNINATSSQLRVTLNGLSPSIDRLTKGELLQNLETLSANAAEASSNLRNASKTLNDPNNIVVLQQTLDSARVTFENTQKITSDLDELTGNPQFRQNLRQLVNGLSNLVSSTEQIEQQVKFAATLDSVKASLDKPQIPTSTATKQQPFRFNSSSITAKTDKEVEQTKNLKPSSPSQEELLKQLREYQKTRQ